MREEILVSVIMPAYNTEKYIKRAVESVKKQTLKEWELICVDDASTDRTPGILDRMASQDNRILVIHLEENGGQGKARNIGLDMAKGRYIFFLDSDDYIKEECFQTLFDIAEENGCEDIYYGKQIQEVLDGLSVNIYEDKYFGEDKEYTLYSQGIDFLYGMIRNNAISYGVWQHFLKKSYLKRFKLYFVENIIYEDVVFVIFLLLHCRRLCYLRKELYFYCRRKDSTVTTRKGNVNLYSQFLNCMLIYEIWYKYKDNIKSNKFDTIMDVLYRKMLGMARNTYMILTEDERKICKDKIAENKQYLCMYEYLCENHYEGATCRQISKSDINFIKKYNKIIIYGAGCFGTDVYIIMKRNYIPVLYFAVTENINIATIDGVEVKKIDDLLSLKDDVLVIIAVSKKYFKDVVEKLKMLKFKNIFILEEC